MSACAIGAPGRILTRRTHAGVTGKSFTFLVDVDELSMLSPIWFLRKRLARRGGRLLRRVLLRSAHLPLLPQNRSTVTAVLSTRHLARYSPNGLRQATGQGAGGRLDTPR